MLHDYDKIKRLQAFIEANTTDWRGIQDKGVLETDLLWEASRFWAQVIFKANPLKYDCTLEDFEVFKHSDIKSDKLRLYLYLSFLRRL